MRHCSALVITVAFFALTGCGDNGDDSMGGPGTPTGDAAPDVAPEAVATDTGESEVFVPDAGPEVDAADTDVSTADAETDADSPTSPEAPLFDAVASYTVKIASSGDETDVYHPNPSDLATGGYVFPIALMMQGAKVDKQHYSMFAGIVASYGFVVVVPNHESMSMTGTGLYMQPSVVHDVIGHMTKEQQSHPVLSGKLDLDTLVLLGHSYGGVVAMQSLQGICQFPFCVGGFDRPASLKAGALFGTNMKPPFGGIPETDNTGWGIALVQGDQDQKAKLADTVETYEKVKAPPKALVTLAGVNHYGICNTNNPPGADADQGKTTIDQAVAVETAARWSALFLRAHVLSDQGAHTYVHQTGDAADNVVTVASVP